MKQIYSAKSKKIPGPDANSLSVDKWIIAAQQAVRAALREHKRAGNPIAIWRDGKVVLIPPEQIET